jgi:MOSC domain-containing protein YiiM
MPFDPWDVAAQGMQHRIDAQKNVERQHMAQHVSGSTQDVRNGARRSDEVVRSEDDPLLRKNSGGTLERIWLKRAKGGVMDGVTAATLEVDIGLRGNANRGGRRQVTIISQERWAELIAALGADLPPAARRANLMVSGINLENSRGRVLRVGSTRLRINGETRPCEQMEQAHAGLQELMRDRWGGGAIAEVLEGGEIQVGASARWENQ